MEFLKTWIKTGDIGRVWKKPRRNQMLEIAEFEICYESTKIFTDSKNIHIRAVSPRDFLLPAFFLL